MMSVKTGFRSELYQNTSATYYRNLQELKGLVQDKSKISPQVIKSVAREMESLFIYEMIKAMRSTVETKSDFGKEVNTSMFDLELARVLSQRGIGLQDILVRELEKRIGNMDNEKTNTPLDAKQISGERIKPKGAQRDYNLSSSPIGESRLAYKKLNQYKNTNSTIKKPDGGSFSPPVNGRISSHFGMRFHPVYGNMDFHKGIDIAAPIGTEIRPIKEGKVIFSGEKPGYGNVIVIDHGNGLVSKYAHNKANLVKEGDSVDSNTPIAILGNTGTSTGPHLHLEVIYHGKSINPLELIKEFEESSDKMSITASIREGG
ncbi:Murein DD-endopeptidase MepM [bacterium HR37]|nr:Murein DD-endopeptidase MepM [bacterium HR37]